MKNLGVKVIKLNWLLKSYESTLSSFTDVMAEGGNSGDDSRMRRLLNDLKIDAKRPGFGSRLHALLIDLQEYLSGQCPFELESRDTESGESTSNPPETDGDIELELYSITQNNVSDQFGRSRGEKAEQ